MSVIVPDNVISKVQCATHLPEGQPYKSDDMMFLPVGKSDVPMARCAPLALCGLCLSLRELIRGHLIAVAVIFVRYLLIDLTKNVPEVRVRFLCFIVTF